MYHIWMYGIFMLAKFFFTYNCWYTFLCRLTYLFLYTTWVIYASDFFISLLSLCLIYEPKYKFTYGQLCNPCGGSSYCVYGKYDQIWIHKIYPQVAPLSFVWHSIVDVARLRINNFFSSIILFFTSNILFIYITSF